MKDFTNEEFFDILNNVLHIGYANNEYPKMATMNSLLCLLVDVIDYNYMVNESDDIYKAYADRIQERREKVIDILEKRGYYDEDCDYDYESNMFCDNTGYCCGNSCSNFNNCYGTSNK